MENRKFWFGKHKGEYVNSVCATDPKYVDWCVSNVKGFKLTEEERRIRANTGRRYSYNYDYNEGSVWEEFDNEMTSIMMHNLDD